MAEDALAEVREADLPPGWDAHPEGDASRAVGDQRSDERGSVALLVPSATLPFGGRFLPGHRNTLLNPDHPGFFTAVTPGEVRDLDWDPRLLALMGG